MQTNLAGLVSDQVRRSADAPAVTCDGVTLTYAQLESLANKVAGALSAQGVLQGDRIAIASGRSLETVVVVLAVLKLGAAYVPLPAREQTMRRAEMARDSKPSLIVVDAEASDLVSTGMRLINLATLLSLADSETGDPILVDMSPDDIAWVLYTSGSTGAPKGVLGTHRGCLNRISWLYADQPITIGEPCFQNTALTTVDSFWEILAPLGCGGHLHILGDELVGDVERLIPRLSDLGVRRICLVPSLLGAVLDIFPYLGKAAPELQLWVVSGEVLKDALVERFYLAAPDGILMNQYGMTESCADITYFDTRELRSGEITGGVPIGRAIDGVQLLLLDEEGRHVPDGEPAELHVAGACLAAGYLGRPQETAERFVQINADDGTQLNAYRSGDRVRRRSDGIIEFLGRVDRQVKIRGYRVELDEIEAVLARMSTVRGCAVQMVEGLAPAPQLCAWIEGSASINEGMVREYCSAALPVHMRPIRIQIVSEMPRTATGKIDRARLSLPKRAMALETFEVTSESAEIAQVQSLFAHLLGIPMPRPDADFFEIGGDSLAAIRLAARLRSAFGQSIKISDIFRAPTPAAIVALFDDNVQAIVGEPDAEQPLSRVRERPLSFTQERLLAVQNRHGDAPILNVPYALSLDGQLDAEAMRLSVSQLLNNYDLFRSRAFFTAEGARQIFAEDPIECLLVPVEAVDWSKPEEYAGQLIYSPFLLDQEAPVRCALYTRSPTAFLLVIVFHQSVIDDWTLQILGEELSQIYRAVRDGHQIVTTPVARYSDFAALQRALPASHFAPQNDAWCSMLEGAPISLDLPTDRPRPPYIQYEGNRREILLSPELTKSLHALAEAERVTLYMLLLTTFYVLLHRLSGQDDIVVGTPVANRSATVTQSMVGCFINMLPLRVRLDSRTPFRTLLARVKQTISDALSNQDLPFDRIVALHQVPRETERHPLFEVMFAQRLTGGLTLSLDQVECATLDLPLRFTSYDLTFWIEEREDGVRVQADFATALFDAEMIEALLESYVALLGESFVPERQIGSLDVHGEAARHRLLDEWQGSIEPITAPTFAHQIIDYLASTPDTIAVESENGRATYGDLDRHAGAIAARLAAAGVGRGDIVGILTGRGPELPAAMLAVAMLGAAFLPLDLNDPTERLRFLISDAGVRAVLVDLSTSNILSSEGFLLVPSEAGHELGQRLSDMPRLDLGHEDRCYVLYTSGSTGQPKGVQILHGGLVNLLQDMRKRLEFGKTDRMVAITTVSFDISLLELLLPLTSGGRVLLLSRETASDPDALSSAIEAGGATHVQATPSSWKMLFEAGWKSPRNLVAISGGEPLPPDLADLLSQHFDHVENLYGPTETTIWSTSWRLVRGKRVNIGRPIANTRAYVVNELDELVTIGGVGELLIAGRGVADGYLNRDELTQTRFFEDPFWPGERVYRTGDLVRLRPDGSLDFIGRIDTQCKVRGHRIELGEVETVLRELPQVADAAVTVVGDQLVAHVVAAERTSQTSLDLSLFFFAAEDEGSVNRYRLLLESAKLADQLGLRAVWTPERHFHSVGGSYPNPSILSAALATLTERIDIRGGSVVLPLHSPFRVAEEWAVVDQLSAGRCGVAFASGWNPHDFAFFPDRFERRRAITVEMVDQVRRLWRGEKLPANDGNGTEVMIEVHPRPLKHDIPIWITASGPLETFVAAGRVGANLLTHLLGQDVGELGEKIIAYRAARADAGFEPDSAVVTVMLHAFVADEDEEARAITEAPFKEYLRAHLSLDTVMNREWEGEQNDDLREQIIESAYQRHMRNALIGSPAHCVEIARKMRQIGADEIACLIDFGVPTAEALRGVERLGDLQLRIATTPILDWDEVTRRLKRRLPGYMIPQRGIVVDSLPRTANGKLDRKRLHAVEILPELPRGEAPRTVWEQRICQLWNEALGTEVLDVHTSFFAAGGHSLSAARIIAAVRQRHGLQAQLRDIFEFPTVRKLAMRFEKLDDIPSDTHVGLVRHAEDSLEPSAAQERLLFLQEFAKDATLYNTTFAYRLEHVHGPTLAQAFADLIARHEILQYCISPEGGRFRLSQCGTAIPFVQRAVLDIGANAERSLVAVELETAFDLESERPIRATLIESGNAALFLFTVHHAVSDGWSVGLLMRDLSEFYSARIDRRQPELPALTYRYTDFAAWQRDTMNGARLADGLAYWSEQLADLPDRIDLPTDRRRPATPSYRGETVRTRLSKELAASLAKLAADRDATFFAALLACFTIVLHRHSNADDIAVGAPVVTRPDGTENVVGLFLNTLVMRMRCGHETSFEDLLRLAGSAIASADIHKEVPFERVVEALKVSRDTGRHSLFQVMLVLRNVEEPPLQLSGVRVTDIAPDPKTAKFDLTLWAEQLPDGLELGFEFALDLFDRERIETFAQHFENIVTSVVSNPLAPIRTLEMLNPEQLREACIEAKGEILPLPSGETVQSLFAAQVKRTPSAPAIVTTDGTRDYEWLAARSDAVAAELQRQGVVAGDRVGIFLPRDADLVAGILGVLKVGSAYVPLDPAYPPARIKAMADDAELRAVLVSEPVADRLPKLQDTQVVDMSAVPLEGYSFNDPSVPSDALSHIIYTSGSTGTPKGVEITHANTVAMLRWAISRFSVETLSRALATTSACFDLSVFELFAPLSVGGAVVIAENFLALADHPMRNTVTLCNTVPSVIEAYLGSALIPPSVRTVNLAGEPLTRALCDRIHAASPDIVIYNLYGPSECTTYSLEYCVPRTAAEPLIGRPIANTDAYILDAVGNIVPQGTVGELYLGGAGVARGYRNRAELTAEKFIHDRFSRVEGGRLYATGDMVRRNAEGIEFLGRCDRQIKLNGYRIELGDIEAALRNTGLVQNGIVLLIPIQGRHQLVAYVVPQEGKSPDDMGLRDLLRAKLPAVMIPSHIVLLPSLPLTLNNKIDVRALPPVIANTERASRVRKPGSATESSLLRIWADVLGHENFGLSDNFFDAGGNSLMIMELRQLIVDQLGLPATIVSLFQHPTIASFTASLADSIDGPARDTSAVDRIAQQRRVLRRGFGPDRRNLHAG